MVRKAAAVLTGLLFASGAAAQVQTEPRMQPDKDGSANLAQQRLSAEGERDNLMKKTGKLVAAGDCPTAIRVALQNGDFSLAAAIRTYCSTEKPK